GDGRGGIARVEFLVGVIVPQRAQVVAGTERAAKQSDRARARELRRERMVGLGAPIVVEGVAGVPVNVKLGIVVRTEGGADFVARLCGYGGVQSAEVEHDWTA